MFKKTPYTEFSDNKVRIHNIRNFTYKTAYDFEPNWYDKEYDLDKLSSVDYIVNPYALGENVAHTFLSFGFDDGTYVSVSIE